MEISNMVVDSYQKKNNEVKHDALKHLRLISVTSGRSI